MNPIKTKSEKSKSTSTKSTKSAAAKPVVHATAPSQADPRTGGAPPATSPALSSQTASPSPATQSFAERVTAAVEHITQAKTLLGLDTSLSVSQIKHSLKLKKGGEQYVPTLADLSVKYGVEVPSRPTADMVASFEKVNQLAPAKAAIGALSKIVEDAHFSARSETWSTATSLYSMLKKGAPREPNLASALAPLQDFFAHRHPLVAAEHPKRSPAKAMDKEQQKVAKRIAKLQAQIATLQAAAPAASAPAEAPAAAPTPAPAVPSNAH